MAFYRVNSGGTSAGSAIVTHTGRTTITLGFKPTRLITYVGYSYNSPVVYCNYNGDVSTSTIVINNQGSAVTRSLPNSTFNEIYSINDDGFTYSPIADANLKYLQYIAL